MPRSEATPAATPAPAALPGVAPTPPQYSPPPWSAIPDSSFSLEVIKDGCVVETLNVSAKAQYVLGRHASTADLVCAHPSVSRQHCVLQHSETGEVFLYDLGSTHGTFINKKQLAPREHVALRIGAGVKLGLSSRILTLMGEVDPARESMVSAKTVAANAAARQEAMEKKAEERAERIAAQTGRSRVSAADLHARSDGAGWGMGDDAEFDAEGGADAAGGGELGEGGEGGSGMSFEELVATAKSKGLKLSVKQERLIEQLEKRTAKMLNLKQETERIAAKEIDGLSEGQQRQVERNTTRLSELSEQIEALKEQISETVRDQLGARSSVDDAGGKGKKGGRRRAGGSDDSNSDGDDDYFDRTDRTKALRERAARNAPPKLTPASAGGGGGVESEASLVVRLEAAKAKRAEIVRSQDVLSVERARLEAQQAAADPLDRYMIANTIEVAGNRARDLARQLDEVKQEEAQVSKLLAFVAPALPAESPAAASSAAASSAATSAMPPPPGARGAAGAASSATRAAGPAAEPPSKRPKLDDAAAPGASSSSVAAAEAPAAAVSATSSRFQSEFAAALAAYTSGGVAPSGAAGAPPQLPSAAAPAAPSAAAADRSTAQAGASAALDAEREAEAAAAAASRRGLGSGSARPDAEAVAAAKASMAQQQARAQRDASMVPGLNKQGAAAAATATTAQGPARGPARGPAQQQGPARGPVQGAARGPTMPPQAAKGSKGARAPQAGPQAEEDPDFVWSAPKGQSGDGKTDLNKKLGY